MERAPQLAPRSIFLYADIWHGATHCSARGIVEGRYEYTRDLLTGRAELFGLDRDPNEVANLVDTLRAVRGGLAEKLDAWDAHESSRN